MDNLFVLWAYTSGLPIWLIILNVAVIGVVFFEFICGAPKAAFITILIAAFADWLITSGGSLVWLIANWQFTLGMVAVYAVIGIIWGIVRWYIYLSSEETKTMVLNAHKDYTSYYEAYKGVVAQKTFKESIYNPFSWRKDSATITSWIVFWPISIIWTFFSEIISRALTGVWNGLKGIGQHFAKVYSGMADKTIDKVLKDK